MDGLLHDIRAASRQFRESPAWALTVVLILALAIGANTAVLSVVDAWLLRPLPLKDPQQLVAVWRNIASNPGEPAYFDFYRDFLVWQRSNRTMTSLAATFPWEYTLTGAGEPRQIHGAMATWNIFATVGATAAVGRVFGAEDVNGDPVCVIGYAFWRTQFGQSRDVIGRTVRLNGTTSRIIGVLPASFSLRVLDRPFEIDVWRLITAADPYYTSGSLTPAAVIGRLKEHASSHDAQDDLNVVQRELNRRFAADEPRDSGVLVSGLQQDNTRTVRGSLLLLWAAVAVLLGIAFVNAGSLIVGRHGRRAAEFAIRLALGCTPGRLFRHLIVEAFVLFAAGGAVGFALAFVLVTVFVARNPMGILPPAGVRLDLPVLSAMTAAVGIAAVLFGALPAMRALGGVDTDLIRTRVVTPARRHLRSRMLFVTAEIALSMVLLLTAGVLIASYNRLLSEPLGFRTSGVYVGGIALPLSTYSTPPAQARAFDELVSRLRATPSVDGAAAATSWPFQANGSTGLDVEGTREAPGAHGAFALTVGPGFFDTLGARLLRGRDFNQSDRAGTPDVAVINDELAREYFGAADPVGRRIRLRGVSRATGNEPWMTVVGVVSTMASLGYNRTDWDHAPAVYTSLLQRRGANGGPRVDTLAAYLFVKTSHLDQAAIKAAVHAVDADLPLQSWRSTADIVDELRAQPEIRASIVGSFAALTLLLALVGVYGVMTQFVEQQRREIGIRVALGAGSAQVVALVLRRTGALIAAGLATGALATWATARLLDRLVLGTSAQEPVAFTAAAVMLAAVAGAASYLPARRAAAIDPAAMVRGE